MKSLVELRKKSLLAKDVANMVREKSESGLIQSGKALHPTVFNPKTRLAAVFTTKNQEEQASLLIDRYEESRCYAQMVSEKNKFIDMSKITKEEIRKLIFTRGIMNLIISHKIMLDTNFKVIIFNEGNKQKFINIDDELRSGSSKFIEECGGKEKIHLALNFHIYCTENVNNAKKIIYEAANSGDVDKSKIMKTYENLNILLKTEIHEDLKKQIEELVSALEKL
jgi:hypothetical protein